MIQTLSKLKVADNSGAKLVKVLSVRGGLKGGGHQKFGRIGDVVSVSVMKAIPYGTVAEHEKMYGVIVRTKKEIKRKGGSYIRFDDNAVVLINIENKTPIGTRIFGPVAREIKAKGFDRIISLAPEVL